MTAPRILVVEDERIIALHLRQQLTKLGYDVPNAVSTGDHALRRIVEAQPDLVLMDINLKGTMDGIATVAAIPPAYRIPIIYLTSYSTDETVARAAATNPHGYILKPFSERELHAMIQVTLARCRAERTSRAEAERQQRARKMEALSQLAAGMADEVDDLLTVFYDQLDVLGSHAIGAPALAEPIQDAFSEAVEKERLINRLLDFSGRRKLAPADISVHDLVSGVTGLLRRIVGDAIQLRVALPDDLWEARVDPDQLSRALVNLVTNSREAMPDGGRLTIEGQNTIIDQNNLDGNTDAGRYVLLRIVDTGTGMPEHLVERVFEPFFTTRSPSGGRGLGLSLVFGFMQQSGGHISIDSKPGSGTAVRIYLPAATQKAAAIASANRGFGVRSGPPRERVSQAGMDLASDAAATLLRRPDEGIRHAATPRKDSASPVLWEKAESALFASVLVYPGPVRYRLIVEPLPKRNGWDWTVWRPGSGGKMSLYGRASSVVGAMAAAEDAAGRWGQGGPPDLAHPVTARNE
jgi:signal transduction histidine kinase